MSLIDDINTAIEAKDYEQVKTLMAELIAEQKLETTVELTDEELLNKGIDLLILTKERELRDRIKQAEQDGDFLEAKELMRELLQIQQLQPVKRRVRMFV
jgi:hypothetical protein